jgi:hypothetical protein
MEELIDDYFRCLICIGWEDRIYIKKDGAFDKLTIGIVEKTETGFSFRDFDFVYLPD